MLQQTPHTHLDTCLIEMVCLMVCLIFHRHSTVGEAVDIAYRMRAKNTILTHFSSRFEKMVSSRIVPTLCPPSLPPALWCQTVEKACVKWRRVSPRECRPKIVQESVARRSPARA